MATYYWVGGSGTWNASNLANWASSSGGAGYAGVPTSADDVVFDANSGGTDFTITFVTGAVCKDFTASGLSAVMTVSGGSTAILYVYGSFSIPATNFVWSSTAASRITFAATTTGHTVTTNGVTLTGPDLYFDGVGGGWELGSALTMTQTVVVLQGTFSTSSSNYSVTCNRLLLSGFNARTVNLNASTVTVTGATAFQLIDDVSLLTFNAGTSSILCSNTGTITFTGGGKTFYDVSFTGAIGSTSRANISGANTFNNLSFASRTVSGTRTVTFDSNQTVSGTLTCSSTNYIYRTLLSSSSAGTQRTITAAAVSFANTDFQDIAAAGASSPWTAPASSINYGNNNNITFPSATTLYWIGGSGNWSDGTKWSTTSGGSAANTVPTSTTSVIFDAGSNVGTGTFTVTVDGDATVPSLCNNFSTGGAGGALDGAMTLTLGASAYLDCYGSITLPATNFTWNGTTGHVLRLYSSSSMTLTTNGVTLTQASIQANGTGTYTLGSALTIGQTFLVNSGTFDTANYSLTCATLTANGTTTRAFNLGSSSITCSALTPINITNPTNLTWNAGTSTITCSNASPGFNGGNQTFYNVTFSPAAAGTTTIAGANTFNNLNQTSRSATGLRILQLNADQTINGTLTLGAANTAIRRVWVYSDVSGTQRTLTAATVATLADVDFRDIVGAGTGVWSGTRIGNGQNNSGITFTAGTTKYWNLAAGGSWSSTAWATSSGGTVNANNFPLAQDTVVIENTGLNTSATITCDQNWWLPTINASTRTNAWTFAFGNADPWIFGDLNLNSTTTTTGTSNPTIIFAGNSITQNITTNGVNLKFITLTVDAPNGTVKLLDNCAVYLTAGANGTISLLRGTLDLNGYTLTANVFSGSNSNTRAIAWGTGKMVLLGAGTTIYTTNIVTGLTYTGTPRVDSTYNGSTGTRSFNFGSSTAGQTEALAVSLYVTAGTDSVTLTTNTGLKDVDFTGFSGTLTGTSRNFYGNVILSPTMVVADSTGQNRFYSPTTQTLTSNGVTIGGAIVVDSGTGTFTLADALVMNDTRTITITSGTFDTNNQSVTCGGILSSNTNVRTINLGSSTINLAGIIQTKWTFDDSTNLTFNCGTSTINCDVNLYSGNSFFSTGNQTFNNVVFTNAPGTIIITGAATFANLTATNTTSARVRSVLFVAIAPITVTGTLTCTGGGYDSRINFSPYLVSTDTITVNAGAVSLAYVNFAGTIAGGASIDWTGTNLGDTGGNQNIIFDAPKTVYWSSALGGAWGVDNVWASTSGGTPSLANYPLPQDLVIIDDAGISSGSSIAMNGGVACGGLDCASLTNTVYFTDQAGAGGYAAFWGDVTLSPSVVMRESAAGWSFNTNGTPTTITTAGVVFNQNVQISGLNSIPASVTFADDLTTTNSFVLDKNTLDLDGNIVTCNTFRSTYNGASFNNVRSIDFNGGYIDITGSATTVLNTGDMTGFSYTGDSDFRFTYDGPIGTRTVTVGNTAGATESNAFNISIDAGADTWSTSGASYFRNFYVDDAFTGTTTLPVSPGALYGNLTLSSNQTVTSNSAALVLAATSGTQTIMSNGVTISRPITVNAPNTEVLLADALNLDVYSLTVTEGTFTTNSFNVTSGQVAYSYTLQLPVTFNLGSSVITIIGDSGTSWQMGTSSNPNLTMNADLSEIVFDNTKASFAQNTFNGGGKEYYKVTQAGTNAMRIGAATIDTLANTDQPTTIVFYSTDVVYVNNFDIAGTSGSIVTLGSDVPGSQASIATLSGNSVLVEYCDISDTNVSPAGDWYAVDSTDSGNNTGWVFPQVAIIPTGVYGTGEVGDVQTTQGVGIYPTAVTGLAELGDISLVTDNSLDVTGLSATATLGDESVSIQVDAVVTGLQATSYLGDVVVTGSGLVYPTGVNGTGVVGNVNVWGLVPDAQDANWVDVVV